MDVTSATSFSSSYDDIIRILISQIRKGLQSENIVSHMNAFNLTAILLNATHVLGFPSDGPATTSYEVVLDALIQISASLHSWKQTRRKLFMFHLKSVLSINVPHCCEVILSSILEIVRQLTADVMQLPQYSSANDLQAFLFEIDQQIGEIKDMINQKTSLYPPFVPSRENFYYAIKSSGDSRTLFAAPLQQLLHISVARGLPMPMIVYSKNSRLLEKVSRATKAEMIASSTDPICQICREDLEGKKAISFLQHCRHVCCDSCMLKWVKAREDIDNPWICPSCKQPSEECGTIMSDGDRKVSRSHRVLWGMIIYSVRN